MSSDELVPVIACDNSGVRGVADPGDRERVARTLLANLPGMAYRCADDPQWTMEFVSAGAEELTGYRPEDLIGNARLAYADLIAPWHCEAVCRDIQAAIAEQDAWTISYPIITASGARKWVWERGVAVRNAAGEVEALEGLIVDMTAEHEAEERLAMAVAQWRQTFDSMSDAVILSDAVGVVLRANAATAALTGCDVEAIVGQQCCEVLHGRTARHPDCPQQRAMRSGEAQTSVIQQGNRWLRVTFQPMLGVGGGVHVVSDVTEVEQARRTLVESVSRQQGITEGVIAAMAATSDLHDPWTAGHQRRVGELAAAIARAMGIDEDRIVGVRVAALVHDVGKINVPAVVLAKPGRLSARDFDLIRAHAQAGYDFLSPIEFPWPVAKVALQHHERLDGSGYPAGLAQEAIIPEARILAVADVAEAMISHRPYRAALALDAALAELENGAGSRYDAAACEAAIRLFREEGFGFVE